MSKIRKYLEFGRKPASCIGCWWLCTLDQSHLALSVTSSAICVLSAFNRALKAVWWCPAFLATRVLCSQHSPTSSRHTGLERKHSAWICDVISARSATTSANAVSLCLQMCVRTYSDPRLSRARRRARIGSLALKDFWVISRRSDQWTGSWLRLGAELSLCC